MYLNNSNISSKCTDSSGRHIYKFLYLITLPQNTHTKQKLTELKTEIYNFTNTIVKYSFLLTAIDRIFYTISEDKQYVIYLYCLEVIDT